MFLSFSSFILFFLSLRQAIDGFVVKDLPESKPENHLKNKDDDLHVDLIIHDDEYNGVEYDLSKKLLTERFEESERRFKDNYDKRPKGKIAKPGTEAVATLPTFHPMEKSKVTMKTQVEDHLGEAIENVDSKAMQSFRSLKTGFRILKKAFSADLKNCNCTATKAYAYIGNEGIKCLFAEHKDLIQPFNVLTARVWHVALIWVSVYGAVAMPLWCIKGWCCCCLRCKFFQPQETIQEAKNYLLLNPPGLLVTKKGAIIHYEPTEREKDCYEEFGHFMRTL